MNVQDLANTIVGQAVEIEGMRTRVVILEAENQALRDQVKSLQTPPETPVPDDGTAPASEGTDG